MTFSRVIHQWFFDLVVLLVLSLVCACNPSNHEALPLRQEIDLPAGSLFFTVNHRNLFRLDSSKPGAESITEVYTDLGRFPSLSPDASRVTFVWMEALPEAPVTPSDSMYYPYGLYLLQVTSSQEPELLWRASDEPWDVDGDPFPRSPCWSPDANRIVFLLEGDVYMLDPETLALERLLKCEESCRFVVTSPIGNRLLLTSINGSDPKQQAGKILLWKMNGTARVLIEDRGIDYVTEPSWSPDESQIAFTMQVSDEGYRSVFLINSDGTGLQRLTEDKAFYYSPVWSPDGKMLPLRRKRMLAPI